MARPGIESMAMLMTIILMTSMIGEHQYIHRSSDSVFFKKKCNEIEKKQKKFSKKSDSRI